MCCKRMIVFKTFFIINELTKPVRPNLMKNISNKLGQRLPSIRMSLEENGLIESRDLNTKCIDKSQSPVNNTAISH